MYSPPWYRDFKTGERVHMRYCDPPMMNGESFLSDTVSTVEGILEGFSMDPVEGYPWNAHPHAVSLRVIDDAGEEHRAPINRIVDIHPSKLLVS